MITDDFKTFETLRLTLRPTSEEDCSFIYQIMNSPKYIANIGCRNIFSEGDAKIYIREKILTQLHKLGYSIYTVIRKNDGSKIGTCGLVNRNGIEGTDIGFAFLPQFEKQGYAFECASELKRAAIEEFNILDLKAITKKTNKDSINLLSKLGFRYSGIIVLPEEEEELLIYTL